LVADLRSPAGDLRTHLAARLRTVPISAVILATVLGGRPTGVTAQEFAPGSGGPCVISDQSRCGPLSDAASASEASVDLEASKGWCAGIASGWYFPVQAWPTTYRLGGGGMFQLGDQMNRHWAIQLDLNMWLFSGNGRDTWDLKAGPVVLWTP